MRGPNYNSIINVFIFFSSHYELFVVLKRIWTLLSFVEPGTDHKISDALTYRTPWKDEENQYMYKYYEIIQNKLRNISGALNSIRLKQWAWSKLLVFYGETTLLYGVKYKKKSQIFYFSFFSSINWFLSLPPYVYTYMGKFYFSDFFFNIVSLNNKA